MSDDKLSQILHKRGHYKMADKAKELEDKIRELEAANKALVEKEAAASADVKNKMVLLKKMRESFSHIRGRLEQATSGIREIVDQVDAAYHADDWEIPVISTCGPFFAPNTHPYATVSLDGSIEAHTSYPRQNWAKWISDGEVLFIGLIGHSPLSASEVRVYEKPKEKAG